MPSSLGFDLSYPPVLAAPLPYTCLGKGALVKRSNRAKSEPCHLHLATSLGSGGAPYLLRWGGEWTKLPWWRLQKQIAYQLTRPGLPNHTTVTEWIEVCCKRHAIFLL
jgi:hypothetical protein